MATGDRQSNTKKSSEFRTNSIKKEDNVFEVDKIVGITKIGGKVLYRVRWLGYKAQDDTWEPYENLVINCKDLVEEFIEKEQKKSKKAQSAAQRSKKLQSQQQQKKKALKTFVPVVAPLKEKVSGSSYHNHSTLPDRPVVSDNSDNLLAHVKTHCDGNSEVRVKEVKQSTSSVQVPVIATSTDSSSVISTVPAMHNNCATMASYSSAVHVNLPSSSINIKGTLIVPDERDIRIPEHNGDSDLIGEPRVARSSFPRSTPLVSDVMDKTSSTGVTAASGNFSPKRLKTEHLRRSMDSKYSEISNEAFSKAVLNNDSETVKISLKNSKMIDLEQPTENGTTLLMYATVRNFDHIVEYLIKNGADINARYFGKGTTPLIQAVEWKRYPCVLLLLNAGAHINALDKTNETALFKACKIGSLPLIRLLLNNGADFHIKNTLNKSPMDVTGHPEAVTLIVNHITEVQSQFEEQILATLNKTAKLLANIFPLRCLSLNESTEFIIDFEWQDLEPDEPGTGMLLFIANTFFKDGDVKCYLYGKCAVLSVTLNGRKQISLTENGNFVLSFSPVQKGKNTLVINTISAIIDECKLVICAYKAQLLNEPSLET